MVMMPKDTNPLGSIFGGVILSHLDLAAGEHARKHAPHRYVTKLVREVEFIAPVHVGDTVSYFTETKSVGKTSITIDVLVEAERKLGPEAGTSCKVTEAEVVMVAIDDKGTPIPI